MVKTGLLDPASMRRIAADIGLKPTKTRGQNFLHDANTVRKIVQAAKLTPGETVVEVGPGLGSLTLGLLEAGVKVIAVEIDPLLASSLPRTIAERMPQFAHNLTVITADALDVTELPAAPTSFVANLPYNVSVPVVLHFCAQFPSWNKALVMVQREVADRLVATPGSRVYGTPSVKLKWYADSQWIAPVPPQVFWPVPRVDSGLVEIVRHHRNWPVPRDEVFAVIDEGFNQRRKMIRSALSGLAGSSAAVEQACAKIGLDPQLRAERLTLDDFIALAETLSCLGEES